MAARSPNFLANGNINPCVFVKNDSSGNFLVVQAAADTDLICGISQEGTHQTPGLTGSDGYAAHAGEGIQVFGQGEECQLIYGATVIAGQYLVSDANGNGVPLTPATGVVFGIGAKALENGNATEKHRVVVTLGTFKSA